MKSNCRCRAIQSVWKFCVVHESCVQMEIKMQYCSVLQCWCCPWCGGRILAAGRGGMYSPSTSVYDPRAPPLVPPGCHAAACAPPLTAAAPAWLCCCCCCCCCRHGCTCGVRIAGRGSLERAMGSRNATVMMRRMMMLVESNMRPAERAGCVCQWESTHALSSSVHSSVLHSTRDQGACTHG